MKTIEIIGYKRANLKKQVTKQLRNEAHVPGVLYGGEDQVHFYTPVALLKELVYTPRPHFIKFNLEGTIYKCMLQEVQYHPVSEMILHIDLLQIFDNKKIKMLVPTELVGSAPGVTQGGKLVHSQKKLYVSAYPNNMPDTIEVDISSLGVGQMVRISHLKSAEYTILAVPNTPIAVVETTRTLRAAGEVAAVNNKKKKTS
jgi:large subunit ribosomal protein L25